MTERLSARWLAAIWQDGRYAFRSLRRTPLFAGLVVLTLAISIGASTAVFSMVDRLLFRALPYPRADRLVSVGITGPIDTNEFMIGRTYFNWRRRSTPFVSLTSMLPAEECDLGEQNPIRIHCIYVEANFLSTLGISPLIGRNFTEDDDRPNAPRVALISNGLWQARFAGNPNALQKTLLIEDQPTRVIGVLPATFEMPQLGEADVLMTEQLDQTAQLRDETGAFLRCFARLKDDITLEQAREQMQPLYVSSLADVPPMLRGEVHFMMRSLRDRQIHDARLASWLLLGTVFALLLIACSNVANLMLLRGNQRGRELAMRAALGAGRMRLMQLSLSESLFLGLAGGTSGVLLAWGLLKLLIKISPNAFLRLNQAGIDLRVLVFAFITSLLAVVLFGAAAALRRPQPEELAGWHVIGLGRGRLRQALVAFQVAISLVLLTGSSLFARSLLKLESQQLGMEAERVITVSFVLDSHRYRQAAAQNAFYRALETRLASIPGVTSSGISDTVPPGGGMHGRPFSNMRIAGRPPLPEQGGIVAFRYVSPGYFDTLRIRLIAGRGFREEDRNSTQTPIILSASLARKLFGRENPIGHQLALSGFDGAHTVWSPIVGVARDVKNSGLAPDAEPEYYRLRTWKSDNLGRSAVAILRTSLPLQTMSRMIRGEFASLDPRMPISIQTLATRINDLTERPRFVMVLLGSFAGFGLLLTAVGLYGVVSFLVAQQTREIGVRMAMGASPSHIASHVLAFALRWTAIGVCGGLAASIFLTRLIHGLLFEVSPQDPTAFIAASMLLLFAALLAAGLPTMRAAHVDPAVCLRHE
ncbi:MAG TPA: ABC transporter permease [Bryobacteraceae bacterium]|jgi:predicted permease|nr:ABC transporter permease [Bryobacteraceae bacterium]